MSQTPAGELRLDTWVALMAGEQVWRERGDTSPKALARILASLVMVGLGGVALTFWVVLANRGPMVEASPGTPALTMAATVAAAVLAYPPLRIIVGRPICGAPLVPSLIVRLGAFLALNTAVAIVVTDARYLIGIPLGFVLAFDLQLTCRTLGIVIEPRRAITSWALSSLHVGVLGGIASIALLGDRATLGIALEFYAGISISVVVTIGLTAATQHLRGLVDVEHAADVLAATDRERRMRAHWLHDDVLSEIRLASLRLADTDDPATVQRELGDLDHRLRLRQLDDLMATGRVHLYEILQPHLRRAQALGVRCTAVPSLEDTEHHVDPETGAVVRRVIANLVSNAINAGASELAVDFDWAPDRSSLRISVTDDAGGFDLRSVPPGRGLSTLHTQLGGDEALVRRDAPRGSTMIATVPIGRIGAPSALRTTATMR